MREHKYIAWDKVKHRMGNAVLISLNDGLELLEYTGLHDKEGKEIYEGDRLSSIHYRTGTEKHYLNHIVEWSDKYSGWFMRNEKSSTDGSVQLFVYMRAAEEPKIIGNIHESPSLLEET